ncbi:helix-turn-helix domain-containing protein [Ellagibacter isourolithinifaciens]|uniref:helix-turn-helix domain-containing protein n=1 Tax=Ellagibacter isourolithinifaciens TaxID=2137581 RepID=UPI003A92A300
MQSRAFIGVPPVYTGVIFLFSWIYLLFYAQTAGIEAAAPVSLMSGSYTISAFVMCATLVAIAFLPFGRVRFLTSVSVKIASPLLMTVGTVILMADIPDSLVFVSVGIGGVLTGLGSGVAAQQWAMAYRRVGLSVAISSFPLLMAMAVGVCATLMYLPGDVLRAATIVAPAVAGMMFHMVRLEPWPQDDLGQGPRDRPFNFFILLLPFAVFYLASGFLDYFSLVSNYTFVFYALAAFIPLLISGVSIFRTARQGFVSAFLVPICFLVVVAVPFFALGSIAPMAQFVSIGELGIEVLLFIVAVGFADFFSLDALKTYCLVRVVATIFNSIGWYAASYAGFAYGALFNSQASLFVVLIGIEVLAIALSVVIVQVQKGGSGTTSSGEAPDSAVDGVQSDDDVAGDVLRGSEGETSLAGESGSAEPTLEEKCDAVAEHHGLSKRERDVLRLLARGYSSARIQSELYIAPGTVNYHARNIYAKLGVHSKQSLIDLVLGYRNAPRRNHVQGKD